MSDANLDEINVNYENENMGERYYEMKIDNLETISE